ncbi:hypothetical protein B1H26_24520 [Amycolatopsis sp. BJA-103]|nr:hypothetical protein BKN51_20890 [Amycolatopsis sp. BJA-103]PNE16431.1 hypothetical protein B1H26_24520 [Amycolatopsis sp. BJA-103]
MELVRVRLIGHNAKIWLYDASIGGVLNCRQLHADQLDGPVVSADRLRVGSNLLLEGARITSSGEEGAVRLPGAHIGGQFNATGMRVDNSAGPALFADRLQVDASMFLANARITGSGEKGAVRLPGAHIGGGLNAMGMHVDNSAGPTLFADALQVDDDIFLEGARITSSSEKGAVRLLGAHIGGQFNATGMHVDNSAGPALLADNLQVDASMFVQDAHFTGSRRHDALGLRLARIGGRLVFTGTRILNGAAKGIDLEDAQVDGPVFFPARIVCLQPWGHSCPSSHLVGLDGFRFNELAQTDWRRWLHLIRFHTAYYSPSPYQQLAAVERAAGHDSNARHILIAQQQDLHRFAPEELGGRLTRSFHQLWGLLGGYGYRARRTAAALLFALAAAGGLGLWAGHVETNPGYAAERTTASGSPGQQCSPVELIGLGLDRGLPFAPTGLRARCDLDTATTSGQTFTVAVWFIQAAIWGLATLALAGYTGLIRKPA